jgi:rare lipoprotein A
LPADENQWLSENPTARIALDRRCFVELLRRGVIRSYSAGMSRPGEIAACIPALALVACGAAGLDHSSAPGSYETGLAVYYSDSLHGRSTASGVPYDKEALTAAHRSLPFGTVVRVTNLENRRSVRVEVNDRGPFGDRRRVIDLSRAAAERIEMIERGVVEVRIEVLERPD